MTDFSDTATTRAIRSLEPGDLWTITMTTSIVNVRITLIDQRRDIIGVATINTGTNPDSAIPSQDADSRALPNEIGLSSVFDTAQAVPGTHDVRIAVHDNNSGGSAIFEVEVFA